MADPIPQPESTNLKTVLDALGLLNQKLDAILAGQVDMKKIGDARYAEAQEMKKKLTGGFNPFGKK